MIGIKEKFRYEQNSLDCTIFGFGPYRLRTEWSHWTTYEYSNTGGHTAAFIDSSPNSDSHTGSNRYAYAFGNPVNPTAVA